MRSMRSQKRSNKRNDGEALLRKVRSSRIRDKATPIIHPSPKDTAQSKFKSIIDETSLQTPWATTSMKSVVKNRSRVKPGFDNSFGVRTRDHMYFYQNGRIISMVWTEGVSEGDNYSRDSIFTVRHGEKATSTIRTFICIWKNRLSCICVEIRNLETIVQTTTENYSATIRGEVFQVELENGKQLIFDHRMIDYSRPRTIETNLKVKDLGQLDGESLIAIQNRFRRGILELPLAVEDDIVDCRLSASLAEGLLTVDRWDALESMQTTRRKQPQDSDGLAIISCVFSIRFDEVWTRNTDTVAGGLDRLRSCYKKSENPSDFYKIGRAFKTLWTEPAGPNAELSDAVNVVNYSEKAFTKIRPFVVISKGPNFSICLSMHTYGGKGAGKETAKGAAKGVPIEIDHVGVYSSQLHPLKISATTQDRIGMKTEKSFKLQEKSLIDFTKLYTISHNVKQVNIGLILDPDIKRLQEYAFGRLQNF